MIKSNQGGRSSPDIGRHARDRRPAAVQPGDTAADVQTAMLIAQLTPTAEETAQSEWVQSRPDLFVPLAAKFLTDLGRSPEELGLDPGLTAEIAAAMGVRLSPRPRLSLVPDLEPDLEAEL
jgi:hypothetical protein